MPDSTTCVAGSRYRDRVRNETVLQKYRFAAALVTAQSTVLLWLPEVNYVCDRQLPLLFRFSDSTPPAYIRTASHHHRGFAAMTTLDRYRGCLLGLAAGDALGTTLEFEQPGSFEPLTDMIGGGPFSLKPGEWTDDTSTAALVSRGEPRHEERLRPGSPTRNVLPLVARRAPQCEGPVLRHPGDATRGAAGSLQARSRSRIAATPALATRPGMDRSCGLRRHRWRSRATR